MQEKSSPNRIFFHNLRHLIHQSGLRDSQVAEAIGVHKGSLSRYFGEQRVPKKSVLNSLSSFFHVSVADLLNTDLTKVADLTDQGVPPLRDVRTDADFAVYVLHKTAELQRTINLFASDLLEKYNQLKKQ